MVVLSIRWETTRYLWMLLQQQNPTVKGGGMAVVRGNRFPVHAQMILSCVYYKALQGCLPWSSNKEYEFDFFGGWGHALTK